MTIVDIMKLAGDAEDGYRKAGLDPKDAGVTLKLYRECGGRKAVILPGLLAHVVQWGNKVHPSIVILKCKDLREWAGRSEHALLRTWSVMTDPDGREQAMVSISNVFGDRT